jgi:diaminopimelate epimerase
MRFTKYHGLGNDYLVVEESLTLQQVRRICDRHYGVGADGVMVRLAGPEYRVKIYNPDGSVAEKSGNGLRIFARYIWERGYTGSEFFTVQTDGGPVRCQVLDGGERVRLEMGQVRFLEAVRLEVGETALQVNPVDLGNPHCVVLREQVSAEEAQRLGPLLEGHPYFPNRTNVQFVQVLGANHLRIEIYERGAGYTLASGSSACAAAAVAFRLGLCRSPLEVVMPGGSLSVTIKPDWSAELVGPVVKVMEGDVMLEAFE